MVVAVCVCGRGGVMRMKEECYNIKAMSKASIETGQPRRKLSTGTSVGQTCGRFHGQASASLFALPTTRFLEPSPMVWE